MIRTAEIAARPTLSTWIVGVACVLAVAPYGMVYLPWHFDTAIFEGPALVCFFLATLLSITGAILAIRGLALVPNWQWRTELGVAFVSALLLLNLLRMW